MSSSISRMSFRTAPRSWRCRILQTRTAPVLFLFFFFFVSHLCFFRAEHAQGRRLEKRRAEEAGQRSGPDQAGVQPPAAKVERVLPRYPPPGESGAAPEEPLRKRQESAPGEVRRAAGERSKQTGELTNVTTVFLHKPFLVFILFILLGWLFLNKHPTKIKSLIALLSRWTFSCSICPTTR